MKYTHFASVKAIFAAVFAGWLASFIGSAHAYNIYRNCEQFSGPTAIRWQSNNQTWRIKAGDFTGAQRSEIIAGGNQFATIGGSNYTTSIPSATVSSAYFGNNRNEIYKVYINNWSVFIAWAKYSYVSGRQSNDCSGLTSQGYMIEGDVWLNPNVNFTTSVLPFSVMGNSANAPRDMRRVLMHEIGHLSGHVGRNYLPGGGTEINSLSHESYVVTTMNNGGGQGGVLGMRAGTLSDIGARNKLHADDGAYIRFLYPGSSTVYDVAGSRFKDNPSANGIIENKLSTTQIRRGSGYYLPYTIENLGSEQVDAKVEVWMTQDGVLDGLGSDIKITNNGGPLYHLYTMDPYGRIPGTSAQRSKTTTREGQIYFIIPNNINQFPTNSTWLIGYNVTMPYLPGGIVDADPVDNWVSFRSIHTVIE